jgi:hypothetical protein
VTEQAGGAGGQKNLDLARVAQQFLALLANVAVLTGLLVYFGWQRMETQAVRMGFDESILDLSTQDYLLRSVGPVLRLVLIVGVAGLVAVPLAALVRRAVVSGGSGRRATVVLVALAVGWVVLPGLVVLLGVWFPAFAYVAFPLSIGLGVLLIPFALDLRAERGARTFPPAVRAAERVFAAVVVVLALFWATSNYAEVLGTRIADRISATTGSLTQVAVLSPEPLNLAGPGVAESEQASGAYRFRYTGLRLLEHTDQGYVLLSGEWSYDDGVVFVLPPGPPLRFEFGGGVDP